MKRAKPYYRLLIAVPLAVGMFGFLRAGTPVLDALYQCVVMYVLSYTGNPPNALVELARWIAPLATAGSVLTLVNALRERLAARWRYLKGDSVAVLGPEAERKELLNQLGGRGVSMKEAFLPARQYVLLGTEEENFSFYSANAAALRSHPVYLRCASLAPESMREANLRLFSPEGNAARLYWRERNVYALWKAAEQPIRIVLLGFGKLGEALLYHGLQMNIFAEDQQMEYHIFGDCAAFLGTHTELGALSDLVIAHDEPWYAARELLEAATIVLITEQKAQTALVQELLAGTVRTEIDVLTAGESALPLLEGQKRLRRFDWQSRAMQPELILGDTLFHRAKMINLRYAHLYNGTAETPENADREWAALDGFTRGSNISAADYHEIRLQMLRTDGLPAHADALPEDALERLSILEHVRWCRYHQLNNWRFGVPETGAKDAAKRIHSLLVTYNALSEADKEKDRENIRVLLAIE